jgi:hypothetical protein
VSATGTHQIRHTIIFHICNYCLCSFVFSTLCVKHDQESQFGILSLLINSKWWVLLDFGDLCSLRLATCVYRPPSSSRLDYKQHLQINHISNTDFCCKLTVLSSGVIYYFVYIQINCIYTRNALLRLEALVAELGAIRQQKSLGQYIWL